MNSRPCLSVIIPVYNAEQFIADALDSVQRQNHDNLEVIVIDDGSTDKSAAIIQHHKLEVVYHYQSNRGPQHARNLGLSLAKGKYIAFLDADDLWADNKLETQLPFMQSYEVVVGHTRLLQGDDRPFLFSEFGGRGL